VTVFINKTFTVGEEDAHERLDVFLHQHISRLSRSRIQKLIEDKKVSVNGDFLKPAHRLSAGDSVVIEIPEGEPPEIKPEKIPLDILYEDEELLIVNKRAGMIVHPVSLSQRGTLVHALLAHTRKLSTINGPLRPGIVHRLDKDTSGALLIAKSDECHLNIMKQLQERKLRRRYKALVLGKVEPEKGRIAAPMRRREDKMSVRYIGGKEAVTDYEVCERFHVGDETTAPARKHGGSEALRDFSLLNVSLKTGRTHQIRVHLSSIGHPVAGDRAYGRKAPHIFIKRQALHAEVLGFVHPSTGKYMEFTAPIPEDMLKQIEALRQLARE